MSRGLRLTAEGMRNTCGSKSQHIIENSSKMKSESF